MTHVPVGLATKLGLAMATLLGSVTVVQAFLDGDHSDTTIATLAGLILTVYKIMDGRYNQAEKAIGVRPVVDNSVQPVMGGTMDSERGRDEEPAPFTEDDLAGREAVSREDHTGLGDET